MGKIRKRLFWFGLFILTVLALMSFLAACDERLLPAVTDIGAIKADEIANTCIDEAVRKSFGEKNYKYSDFFVNDELNGMFNANTVTINLLAAEINKNIRNELENVGEERVYVPLGAAFGADLFSAEGPKIKFKIIPYGSVSTDCNTEISSSGINQTAVKIWFDTAVTMKIVHPFTEKKVLIKRKVMVVDTVIKGEVPSGYLFMNEDKK